VTRGLPPLHTRYRLPVALAAAAALILALLWVTTRLSPPPPTTLRMATGPEGSAYSDLGERYREILGRSGVDLQPVATAGAVENLARLRDPRSGVDVAFLQAGTTSAAESPGLRSLGTVFYEPLWLFHRGMDPQRGFSALRGKRLSIGPEGSATRALSLQLLALGGIDASSADLLALSPEDATEALTRGQIDFAAVVTSWDAPVVRRLLADPGVELASFPRADAYLALSPHLSKLILPEGVADLDRDIPPADVVLLAAKASLIVREGLHPALQYLLLEAASEVHATPGLFRQAGEFPAAEAIDLPLAKDARHFYKAGQPFLQRYLPFWAAVLTERLLLLLVPLFGVILPLARILPGLYQWLVRRRIFSLYRDLKMVELATVSLPAGARGVELIARLDELEDRASRLRVPQDHAWLAYTLRHHIRLVRERLE
jgi:TRAP-type uncharacterized transport system substrate-binding protein